MRILVFMSSTNVGGTERVAMTLANHWQRRADVLFAVCRRGPLHHWLSPAIQVMQLGKGRVRSAILPLTGLVRSWRPDILFAPKPDAALGATAAWQLNGRRSTLVLRESNHRSAQGVPASTLFMKALGWAYRNADAVVAPSAGVAEDLCSRYGLKPNRLHTIPNPLEIIRIQEQASVSEPAVVARRKDASSYSILAAGRLIPQKGFDVLLRAMDLMRRMRPEKPVHLTILGEGPQRRPLTELAAELGLQDHVHMPGSLQAPYAQMSQADVFVLPSRWEGFPNALVEAQALGLPVVATRCPAGPDEIIEHERTGILVDTESPGSLAEGILRLLHDDALRQSCGQSAARQALRFDAAPVAGAYLELFEKTLSEKRQRAS